MSETFSCTKATDEAIKYLKEKKDFTHRDGSGQVIVIIR